MDRTKAIAGEISCLLPKLMRGLRAGFMTSPQMSTSQMVTLMRIYEKSPISAGTLSREMHVSASTITGVIDRLVRSGYLKRSRPKTDRRVVNLELTDKGKKVVEIMLSEISKRWHKILTHLTLQESEAYLKLLKKIVQVLGKQYA